MARPLRIEFPGALYHITSRGNAKQIIYFSDEDRLLFLRLLKRTVDEFEWKCYSYCLMSNHYHLLIETPKANLSRGMHLLNSAYATMHNKRHDRSGHLLQGRYHAVLVEKEEYLLEVCRYIVLNPVRAGIVDDPAQYKWSSYLGILNPRKAAPFLDTSYVLSLFSQPGRKDEEEYGSFVLAGLGIELWPKLRMNSILGSEEFASQIHRLASKASQDRGITKRERFAGRPELVSIFGATDLNKDERNKRILEAYLSHGYTYKEIAKHLNLHHSSVCRVILSSKKRKRNF